MSTPEVKKKWILLVEDEEDIRNLVKELILTLGADFGVIESKDGSDARGRIDNQAFNCIVTDLNMPKLSGQGLIRHARGSRLNSTTPVIVITAHPDPKLLIEHEYLLQIEKPFQPKELLKTIADQIRLGATDQRIPIQLFNIFLNSVTEWGAKEGYAPQTLPPKPKGGAQDMLGDYYFFNRFQFYEMKPWIGLGFQREFLDKFPGSDDYKSKCLRISDALWVVHKRRSLQLFNTETLTLSEKLFCERKELADYGPANFRGITIPVQTNLGTMYAEAMVGKAQLKKG